MNKPEQAAYLYTSEHKTYRQIAAIIGVSPASIDKWLKMQGVTAEMGEWANVKCAFCGNELRVMRSRLKAKNYCSPECYHATRQQRPYVPWRQGQRIARAVASKYFALQPAHVVHHEDGDNRNNVPANLKVFASQAHHMAYHHGSPVEPLWDGANQPNPSHLSPAPSNAPQANLTPLAGIQDDDC